MKRIAVDMDGVLADVYSSFIDMHSKEFGTTVALHEAAGKTEENAFPNMRSYVNSSGFFSNVPVIKDSQTVLQMLNRHYDVYIVSAATEFPLSLAEKQAWLNIHFPFISWQQMVFCGSKQIIRADIMIDDHFKNLNVFDGKTFLFTQPHNQLADDGRHTRVHTWEEIRQLLLP